MLSQVRPAIVSTILFTLLLGLAYPLAITGVSKLAFPFQAGGSLLKDRSGQVIGSALIGQAFAKPEYLHPRPSAAGSGYDASASSGSNYGPLNPDLAKRVKGDADALRAEGLKEVPADAVDHLRLGTRSGHFADLRAAAGRSGRQGAGCSRPRRCAIWSPPTSRAPGSASSGSRA